MLFDSIDLLALFGVYAGIIHVLGIMHFGGNVSCWPLCGQDDQRDLQDEDFQLKDLNG